MDAMERIAYRLGSRLGDYLFNLYDAHIEKKELSRKMKEIALIRQANMGDGYRSIPRE